MTEVRNRVARRDLYFVSAVVLLVVPTAVYAQRIPDSVVWSIGAGLLAPIIAVPIKFGIARLSDTAIRPLKLWILCLVEWLLWFPIGFVVARLGGIVFGVFILLIFSTWLHRPSVSTRAGFAKYAIGVLLALPTPVLALLLFGSVLLFFISPGVSASM